MKETKTEVKRTRKNKVEVFLNEKELERLDYMAIVYDGDRSKTLRDLITNTKLPVQPSVEIKEFLTELSRIGKNLNQIAMIASKRGYIDEIGYSDDVSELFDLIGEIRGAFARGGVPLGNHKNMGG